jgi:hypothetical protein
VASLADTWAALLEAAAGADAASHERALFHDGEPCGSLRVVRGRIAVVDTRLVLPTLGIDSVMLHAFAPGSSASPHLVSDLAALPDGRWHFHVDLLPRTDAVLDAEHVFGVYPPLDEAWAAARAIEGSSLIDIPRPLRALSSAWIVGQVVGPDDEAAIDAVFRTYAQRFDDLVAHPPPASLSPDELRARDQAHRGRLFHASTDIVWDVLEGLIGTDAVNDILDAVRTAQPLG